MTKYNEQDVIQLCLDKLSDIHGTPVRFISSRLLGGGCINHALKLCCSVGDFFLKWNAKTPADLFLKEAEGLNEMRLAENPWLIIPKVIWAKEVNDLPGLLLMEYLQSSTTTLGFDEHLGMGIAQLHRKTASVFGFYHPNYCGLTVQDNTCTDNWAEFFAERRIWALVQKINSLREMTVAELKIYERLVAKIPQLLSHQTIPSLIHGDLWSGNYMITPNGPALIDPACYYADREMELGMMHLFGGFSSTVWSTYRNEFPLPSDWEQRTHLYQLYHVLNHYLLFGGSYGRQALGIAKEYL